MWLQQNTLTVNKNCCLNAEDHYKRFIFPIKSSRNQNKITLDMTKRRPYFTQHQIRGLLVGFPLMYHAINLVLPWSSDALRKYFSNCSGITRPVQWRHCSLHVVLQSIFQGLHHVWKFFAEVNVFCLVSGDLVNVFCLVIGNATFRGPAVVCEYN